MAIKKNCSDMIYLGSIMNFFSTTLNIPNSIKKKLNSNTNVKLARSDLSALLPRLFESKNDLNAFLKLIENIFYTNYKLDSRKIKKTLALIAQIEIAIAKLNDPELKFEQQVLLNLGDDKLFKLYAAKNKDIEDVFFSMKEKSQSRLNDLKKTGFLIRGSHFDVKRLSNLKKLFAMCESSLDGLKIKGKLLSLNNLSLAATNAKNVTSINLMLVSCLAVGISYSETGLYKLLNRKSVKI